jgi:hypothetical protein
LSPPAKYTRTKGTSIIYSKRKLFFFSVLSGEDEGKTALMAALHGEKVLGKIRVGNCERQEDRDRHIDRWKQRSR